MSSTTPQIPILLDLILILAVAILTVNLVNLIHMPSVVGFLLAGVIIGPSVLGFIQEVQQIEILAEIGVVLLLFTIGLEFSLNRLREIQRAIIMGGGLQVLLTSTLVTEIAYLAGHRVQEAILFGFLFSLSSTAIVLKVYGSRGELATLHGNFALGVLLFQDLCIVPMMLLTPVLAAPGSQQSWVGIISPLLIGLAAMSAIVISARFLLPRVIDHIVRMKSQEIFTLFIILLCLGTAWLTSRLGLSLALGAFIAGLLLSESEYSFQALANVLPLRDSFAGLFFISIGMLADLKTILNNPWLVLGLVALIFTSKIVAAFITALLLRLPTRPAINASLGLAQIGEFSLLLAQTGLAYHLLSPDTYQQFLASAIISMMAAPFLIHLAPKVGFYLQPFSTWLDAILGVKSQFGSLDEENYPWQDHVVIAGYGENGRNLAKVLEATAIPYLIVDLDILNVRRGKAKGHPIFYADASSSEILERLGIPRARVAVVAISDPAMSRRVVWLIRRLNPEIFLLVRTRLVAEIEELYNLGASQVIAEEFETSIEIFAHVLRQYHIPRNMIELQVQLIRQEGYSMLRGLKLPDMRFKNIQHLIAETLTETFLVLPESAAVGKSLGELALRLKTGVTVIAIIRGSEPIASPGSDTVINSGDILVMMGNHAALDKAVEMLSP
ncbi:MAG: cation:proton antiporter [bacterium]|nr:cation:proton antiporter [bacterium]